MWISLAPRLPDHLGNVAGAKRVDGKGLCSFRFTLVDVGQSRRVDYEGWTDGFQRASDRFDGRNFDAGMIQSNHFILRSRECCADIMAKLAVGADDGDSHRPGS